MGASVERLRRLALAALIAGLGAGVAATLIQSVGAGPLIARAETFEAAAAQGADAPLPPGTTPP
jgi:predicted cobalt transporter CbtA